MTELLDEGRPTRDVEGSGIEQNEVRPPIDSSLYRTATGGDAHGGETVRLERIRKSFGEQIATRSQDPSGYAGYLPPRSQPRGHDLAAFADCWIITLSDRHRCYRLSMQVGQRLLPTDHAISVRRHHADPLCG